MTKNIDKKTSTIIKKYIGNGPHYAKNSTQFAGDIKDLVVEEDEMLVSLDVVSLYTRVPKEEAITLTYNKLKNDPNLKDTTKMSPESIIKLIRICTDNTYFMFNMKMYSQVDGLAIGASISGFMAEIYMEELETKAMQTFANPPEIYKRYVDDTFTKLKTTLVEEFLLHMNSQHERISI